MPATNNDAVHIALPSDFDFTWVLGFLAARTVPALETVDDRTYHRSVRLNGRPITLTLEEVVTPAQNGRRRATRALVAHGGPVLPPAALESAVRRMLDLDADLTRFRRLARQDPILGHIVRQRSGIRLPQLLDPFEGLV